MSTTRKLTLTGLTGAAVLGLGLLLWPVPVPRATGPLPHHAYVWQRTWTDPVLASVLEHGSHFSLVCALAAEVSWKQEQANVTRVPLPYEALHHSGSPVGLALRIGPFGGPFAVDDARAQGLADVARSLIVEARSNGLAVAELQIDFDCAESKLTGYGEWVRAIKQAVAPVPVVITALPAWLKRGAFVELAHLADGYVLQVHSLARPRSFDSPFTLCDPAAARRAVERAARLGRPFRVALPTYGYVTAFDAHGRFLGLSAEGPAQTWPTTVRTREVRADAQAMADLVRAWIMDRPALLTGLIWYRLPVPGDRLNWSWPTLAGVMTGRNPRADLRARTRTPEPGLVEVELQNAGDGEHAGPVAVELRWPPGRLLARDGVNDFEPVTVSSNRVRFERHTPSPPLRPGGTLVAGWLRLERAMDVQVNVVTHE